MTDNNSLNHLITMANQIAINLSLGKSQAQSVTDAANHIKKFWAPSMREKLVTITDDSSGKMGVHIEPLVYLVVKDLAQR